ncbi:hypothetical protein D3C73_1314100 [compost metagenome]
MGPEGSPREYLNFGTYASGLPPLAAVSCARRTLLRIGITRRIVLPGTPLAFFTLEKLNSTSTGAYRSLRTYTLCTPFFFMMMRRT